MELLVGLIIAFGALALIGAHGQRRHRVPPVRSLPGAEANPAIAVRRWEAVRRVADEDVSSLGEQIASTRVPRDISSEVSADFSEALSAYENAKGLLEVATHPDDLQWVTRALDDGRFALAKVGARLEGRELPQRRLPCFFDPRHGPSTGEQDWTPPGGQGRSVPTCAACGTRLRDGVQPEVRQVQTSSGGRPYFQAGPEFGPWARGWYGGSGAFLMQNMLMGTLLMDALYFPSGHDYFGSEDGDESSDSGELDSYDDFGAASDFGYGAAFGDDFAGGDMGSDFGGDMGGDFGGF